MLLSSLVLCFNLAVERQKRFMLAFNKKNNQLQYYVLFHLGNDGQPVARPLYILNILNIVPIFS